MSLELIIKPLGFVQLHKFSVTALSSGKFSPLDTTSANKNKSAPIWEHA